MTSDRHLAGLCSRPLAAVLPRAPYSQEVALTSELALAILLADPSQSSDVLDSLGHAPPGMVKRLTQECVGKGPIRIVAGETVYLVSIDRLDARGIGGFKARGSAPSPPDPLAWPLVKRMDAVYSSRTVGMMLGTAAGAAIGVPFDAGLLGATLGGAVGGRVGSMRVHEEPLYVAQSSPPARLPLDSTATGSDAVVPSGSAAGPSDASAGTAHEPSVERVREATAEIPKGSMVRVTLATMTLTEGKVSRADDVGLHGLRPAQARASSPASPDVIPWARILQVETRVGSSGRGAVIGAAFVGLLGATMGAAVVAGGGIGGGTSNAGSGAAIAGGAAVGALIGGGVGAGLGAMIGAAVPRWHVVY